MSTHVLTHLDGAIDEVHALFDAWAEAGTLGSALAPEEIDVLRLAIHEWVANLVQHATFSGPVRIVLRVEPVAGGVRCAIADSSAGFDFASAVERQQSVLDAPAPSERGRGLLMLLKCAEDLAFCSATPGVPQRIEFTVRGAEAESMATLFRPVDLVWEDDLPGDADDMQGDGHADALPLDRPSATASRNR